MAKAATPPTIDREQDQTHIEISDREFVLCEMDKMETDVSHADPTIVRGEETCTQGMLTDPSTSVHNTEDQSVKREFEAHRVEEPEDKPTTSDEGKTMEEMGSRPKRSKKMVDKTGENSREKSRSMPRRTSHKGKTQGTKDMSPPQSYTK